MIELTGQQLKEAIKEEKVLLDFYTPSCSVCKILDIQMELVESDIPLIKVNAEDNEDLASQFGIMKVPQLILLEEGKEVNRHLGFLPSDAIVDFIKGE